MNEPSGTNYASDGVMLRKGGNIFFSTLTYQGTGFNASAGTELEDNVSKCRFHYFHFFLKAGAYCGMIPYHLTFNKTTGHYQLTKMNIILKVVVKNFGEFFKK